MTAATSSSNVSAVRTSVEDAGRKAEDIEDVDGDDSNDGGTGSDRVVVCGGADAVVDGSQSLLNYQGGSTLLCTPGL